MQYSLRDLMISATVVAAICARAAPALRGWLQGRSDEPTQKYDWPVQSVSHVPGNVIDSRMEQKICLPSGDNVCLYSSREQLIANETGIVDPKVFRHTLRLEISTRKGLTQRRCWSSETDQCNSPFGIFDYTTPYGYRVAVEKSRTVAIAYFDDSLLHFAEINTAWYGELTTIELMSLDEPIRKLFGTSIEEPRFTMKRLYSEGQKWHAEIGVCETDKTIFLTRVSKGRWIDAVK
jgi:hypothetical protein